MVIFLENQKEKEKDVVSFCFFKMTTTILVVGFRDVFLVMVCFWVVNDGFKIS